MAQLKPVAKKQVKAVENPAKSPNFKPPNLDEFLPEEKKTLVSYMEGAKYYSMNYYAFVKLAKEAGANIRIKKKVVIDLQLVDEYLEKNCKGDGKEGLQEENNGKHS